MIDGDKRNGRIGYLDNLFVVKIDTCDQKTVNPPIQAMLQIGHGFSAHIPVIDEGDVITAMLSLCFEAVQ